jgi:hypothetical protein
MFRVLVFAPLLALAALPAYAKSPSSKLITNTAFIVGPGSETCKAFTDLDKEAPEFSKAMFLSYAQGFMTALNMSRSLNGLPAHTLKGLSPDDQMRHLVYYCGNHPTENFISAINSLYDDLPEIEAAKDLKASPAPPEANITTTAPMVAGCAAAESMMETKKSPTSSNTLFLAGMCLGHANTAWFFLPWLASLSQKSATCIPDGVSVGQYIEVINKFMRDHPEERHRDFNDTMDLAAAEAWPCSSEDKVKH